MKWKSLGQAALLAVATFLGGSARADVVQINDAALTGPTINWYRTNVYVLNGYCFVKQGSTLNIEAGTIIKGKDGAPGVFGALFITRGARINALGTANNPIIFTAEADNLGTAGAWPNLGLTQRGLWGGIVLYVQATLNTPSDAGGAAASPKYDVFEGLPDTVINGQNVHRFGGADDNDSCGVMRYVSIRHGGKILESNKELNGLSLCAVGRGTTIEFVEAYAIADDGFEFFGGTVNTRYLVSAFNDDDAFDADQGHRGQHQFWFGIQAPDARDKGFELNGEPTGIAEARRAPILVCSARQMEALVASGVKADVVIGSLSDRGEQIDFRSLGPHTKAIVLTDGERGGRWMSTDDSGLWRRQDPPGERADAIHAIGEAEGLVVGRLEVGGGLDGFADVVAVVRLVEHPAEVVHRRLELR